MDYLIRPAVLDDCGGIHKVYSQYVRNTAVSFEITPPTTEEFRRCIHAILGVYPYYICEINGEIVGFAYAGAHREREAYRYDVDVSIYIQDDFQGIGIGTALYKRLFEALEELEVYNAYAGIVLPNDGSVALHRKFGFTDIGVHHKTGFKLGKWHDILWLEKTVRAHSDNPGAAPVKFTGSVI